MNTSIDFHHCVALYWDRSEHSNHIIHLHIVDEDGDIVTINCYHRDDFDMLVHDVPQNGKYNPAAIEARRLAENLDSSVISVDSLVAGQKRARSRGDDDYSGMSLPDVGSVRESEETQIGDADDGPR